jgi:CHASE1-domain containing sensor protein
MQQARQLPNKVAEIGTNVQRCLQVFPQQTETHKRQIHQLLSQICALATAGIGAVVLIGWLFDIRLFFSIDPNFIPTAPSTAIAFILSGGALAIHAGRFSSVVAARLAKFFSFVVTLFSLLMLIQFITGFDLRLERFLAGDSGVLRGFPIGRMSPVTAALFLLSGLSLLSLFLLPESRKPLWSIELSLAFVVLSVGIILVLGYLLKTPLMYSGVVVPVALPTAVAFVLLGSGLLAAVFPYTRLTGPVITTVPAKCSFLKRYLPVIFIFFFCIFLSAVTADIVRKQSLKSSQDAFDEKTAGMTTALQKVIDRNIGMLEGVSALFSASREVTRNEFQIFSKAARVHHPGIQAVEWVPRVRHSQRPRYEEAARRDGLKDFLFTEKNARNDIVSVGLRPEYYPAYFVEPLQGNEKAIGYDLSTEKIRIASLSKARDTGKITATSRVALMQAQGKHYGVLVFLPFYGKGISPRSAEERRKDIQGFVLGVFKIDTMIKTALHGMDRTGIEITLSDISGVEGERLLFQGGGDGTAQRASMSKTASIAMADRQWKLEFHGLAASGTGSGSTLAILGVGLFLGFLLSSYLLALERYAAGLQDALAEVKTLRGLIPICSYCKKIRGDQGYWDSVEQYVTERTEAVFSHGICPECATRVMSEFEKEKEKLTKP